jgi:hypothetical protein
MGQFEKEILSQLGWHHSEGPRFHQRDKESRESKRYHLKLPVTLPGCDLSKGTSSQTMDIGYAIRFPSA